MPDLNNSIEVLGTALGRNKSIEVVNLRNNQIKSSAYGRFWQNLAKNKELQKISVEKTNMNDKTVEKLSGYIIQPNLKLIELDLSKNLISDTGVRTLCLAMSRNTSILTLNL